jgi:hypothetical protein
VDRAGNQHILKSSDLSSFLLFFFFLLSCLSGSSAVWFFLSFLYLLSVFSPRILRLLLPPDCVAWAVTSGSASSTGYRPPPLRRRSRITLRRHRLRSVLRHRTRPPPCSRHTLSSSHNSSVTSACSKHSWKRGSKQTVSLRSLPLLRLIRW